MEPKYQVGDIVRIVSNPPPGSYAHSYPNQLVKLTSFTGIPDFNGTYSSFEFDPLDPRLDRHKGLCMIIHEKHIAGFANSYGTSKSIGVSNA